MATRVFMVIGCALLCASGALTDTRADSAPPPTAFWRIEDGWLRLELYPPPSRDLGLGIGFGPRRQDTTNPGKEESSLSAGIIEQATARLLFPVTDESSLLFSSDASSGPSGRITLDAGELCIFSPQAALCADRLVLQTIGSGDRKTENPAPADEAIPFIIEPSLVIRGILSGEETPLLALESPRILFDNVGQTLWIETAQVALTRELAERVGVFQAQGLHVGTLAARFRLRKATYPEQGDLGRAPSFTPDEAENTAFDAAAGGGTECHRPGGPDVIVGDLIDASNYTSLSGIEAFAFGTTSCNVGTENLAWVENTNQHPVIGQNMFHLKNDRFEQIGQSWLKHGFFALSQNICGCGCNGQGGSVLGVGCSDPYCCGLNGQQSGLGPKFEVNPHTGFFPYPFTQGDQGAVGDSIYKRLQVKISDLDPAQNGGGLYFVEAQYVTPDDAAAGNQDNNASYRPILVTGSGQTWTATLTGKTQRERPGIGAWRDHDPQVVEQEVRVPGEGLFILSAKATNPEGDETWHYEYALQNLNSDRAARGFSVPVADGVLLSDIGFHDVDYHSGEPFDGTDWAFARTGGALTWSTQTHDVNPLANALRWGTLYNFRMDANVPPSQGVVTIGLFKPGSPASVSAFVPVPSGVPDCDANGLPDNCDIACGSPGGACDLPGCGQAADCNANSVPDHCEADCNGNGNPDDCDVAAGISADCNGNSTPDECESFPTTPITTIEIVTGLNQPLYVTAPQGDGSRLFVVEKGGLVRIIDLSTVSLLSGAFLDLSAEVSTGAEQGLLSLAFSPNYPTDGLFYVNYTDLTGQTVIARYQVSADPNVADAASALVLRTIPQDFANHNGGQLQFGPDGMLYVGMGDGGGGNDPNNRAQDPASLLGKMLRLDVSAAPPYVPADNPFVGQPGFAPEIWALGLRNPWRFSFDRLNGDLYIGDVGENTREELNHQPSFGTGGENYGWRCMEGSVCTGLSGCVCDDPALTDPIVEFSHSGGVCSIIGGYVYRGCQLPDLSGSYFYADLCAGWIRSFRYESGTVLDKQNRTLELTPAGGPITAPVSFGEDGLGELYIVSFDGSIYKIVSAEGLFTCGNALLEPGEQCDDGNLAAGDGCSNTCRLENGSELCLSNVDLCPGQRTGSTIGHSNDGAASCGNSTASADVWYRYIPEHDGLLTIETCGQTDFDTVLSVHSGCPGTALNELACDDDSCDPGLSRVSIPVFAETFYYVRVSGKNGAAGEFELTVEGPPCRECPSLLFLDRFDKDLGWTVENIDLGSGFWERGIPAGDGLRGDPTDDFDGGGACYLTQNAPGNTDVDGGPTRLISPLINGPFSDPMLRYAYWYSTDSGPDGDSLSVDVSTDGGQSWTNVAVHDVSDAAWRTRQVRLLDYVVPTDTLRLRFSVVDNPNNSILEAAVDAVAVLEPCFTDCNGNGIPDDDDITFGQSTDCNGNDVPDECDIAEGTAPDCDGGPVGSYRGGYDIFATICSNCHNANGEGGPGFPGPNIRNSSRVKIWEMLLPPTNHPGGAFPQFTQQDFADLEAFLADQGSRGRPDLIPDQCQTLSNCDGDGVSDACEFEAGTQSDVNYDGLADDCVEPVCEPLLAWALGPRYLSVDVPSGDRPVAVLVEGDPGLTETFCVSFHAQADGTLGETPFFLLPEIWSDIGITGKPIAPALPYLVRADCGWGVSEPAGATTPIWGDTWPSGTIDVDDIICVLRAFGGEIGPCGVAANDLAPCVPNGDADIDDILAVLEAFSGSAFPCSPPCLEP